MTYAFYFVTPNEDAFELYILTPINFQFVIHFIHAFFIIGTRNGRNFISKTYEQSLWSNR